jgi:hypothetical protein
LTLKRHVHKFDRIKAVLSGGTGDYVHGPDVLANLRDRESSGEELNLLARLF